MLDLDKLKRLCEAATAGPWRYEAQGADGYVLDTTGGRVALLMSGKANECGELLATARTALPELIAEVERLRAETAAWEAHTRYGARLLDIEFELPSDVAALRALTGAPADEAPE